MPPSSPPAAASRHPGATVTLNMNLQKSASEPLSDDAVARAIAAAASLSSSPPPALATSTSTSTTTIMPPRAPMMSRRCAPPASAVIRLNVGGVRLEVSRRSLLEREPASMLANLVQYYDRSEDDGECEVVLGIVRDESGALFLDGDGELFKKFVLPYLRSGRAALLPSDGDDRARLALEADYLQLSGLSAALAAPRPFPTSSSSFSSSSELGACSLWLPADEARARAAAAGPEGAMDEALCERGGRLLSALELVLSLARGWILASAPGGVGRENGAGGTGLGLGSVDRNNVSASAATTIKPPPIVCRLRGRGICHVPRPGCFDAFVEEGVVSCGGPTSLSSAATTAATPGASSSSSSSSSLVPSISNASALISRLSSTVEREIAAAENATTSPRQQRSLSSVSTLSSASSSVAASAAAAAAAEPALNPSTSDAAAQQQQQQQQQNQHQHQYGPRTSFSFSRELEVEFDRPIVFGGSYDPAIYCPQEEEGAGSSTEEGGGGRGGGGGKGGNQIFNNKSWDKCSAAERNEIVYAALSSTPLEDPAEAAIKDAVLALAERPALVRSLLVRRFGFAEGTSVRASLEKKVSWRPSKSYGAADVFEYVQATCVIDLAMP